LRVLLASFFSQHLFVIAGLSLCGAITVARVVLHDGAALTVQAWGYAKAAIRDCLDFRDELRLRYPKQAVAEVRGLSSPDTAQSSADDSHRVRKRRASSRARASPPAAA
jgi:hypothetical protein